MRLKEHMHVIQLGTKIHISSKGSLQPLFQYMADDEIYWDIKLPTYRLSQFSWPCIVLIWSAVPGVLSLLNNNSTVQQVPHYSC